MPLSKVLENPPDYNNDDRRYCDSGVQQSYDSGSGIPGEGRPPNYNNNNVANSYPVGFGDNYQNNYKVKPNGQDGYGGQSLYDQQQQEESNIGPYGGGQNKPPINYPNDASLGSAYGAAVGNALPTNSNKHSDKLDLIIRTLFYFSHN